MRGTPQSAALLVGALAGVIAAPLAFAQRVQDVISAEQRRIQQAQESQDEIDGIVETTRSRFDEYQALLEEIDGLQVYNNLVQRQIDDQERQLAELRNSIDNVTVVERQILPLMTRMIDGLERFIELDVPFLLEQRLGRVTSLRQLIGRSDVTTAEQFRNVIEAWQIENDYGSTVETFTGQLQIDGVNREVDFLKIGRVAFLYLTPDGRLAGVWDQEGKQWQSLSSDYTDQIRTGIRIARGQGTYELIMAPVPAPEEG